MDFSYSPDEEAFRSELRTWLERNPPGPEPEDAKAWVTFAKAWQKRLAEAGWCGVAWPKEYGGRGATLIQQIIFQEELARAKAPQFIGLAGLTMGGPVLIAHGTDAQKTKHLRPILSADEIWCQGFSEPNAGSDLAAIKTKAVLDGDDFVVTGQKVWTSWARYADVCMCLVRTDPEAPKHKGITFLLVDMKSPGVTVRPLTQINGDADFNEVFFEDVRVPRKNIVGALDKGWDIAITCLMHERQTLTFSRQLQSKVALTEMLEMARRRRRGDAPATKDRVVRQALSRAFVDSEAMRYLAYRNLTKVLRGGVPGPEGSIEKLFWSEMYQRQVDAACEILGPHSQLIRHSPHAVDQGKWPHLMLYSKGRTIAAGTSEVQRSIIAERVLGLPRGVAVARDALDRLDRAHLVHGFGSPAVAERDGTLRLVRGRGIHVWDAAGRRYVDGLSGLWNVAVGHGRAEIARAMAAQARTLAYAPTLLGFATEPAIRLAARIAKRLPAPLRHVVFTSGGSESNESVIRYVRAYNRLREKPDKIGIVALTDAYHGSSTGAASLTGLATFHRLYGPMMPGVLRIARPHCRRCELGKTFPDCALACADELERTVTREGADRVGAVIVEPVQGVGGVIVPPPGWLERIRVIADRHDLLLVVDEVITGFGRTGRWFGFQHTDVVPDVVVFAKGVTSGYQPLGGVVLHDRVWQTFVDAGPDFALHHGFTYSGHPVACAAALANLDVLERERLVEKVRRDAPVFRRRLDTLAASPIVGDIRAIGLMAAIEIVADRTTNRPFPADARVPWRIREAALRRGLICRAGGDAVMLCPPLVTTRRQLDAIVGTLRAAIDEVAVALGVAQRGLP